MIELHITEKGIVLTEIERGIIQSQITYPQKDNIPEDVREKLSALQLMENTTDLENIGQRVNSEVFWIYTNNDSMGFLRDIKPSYIIPWVKPRSALALAKPKSLQAIYDLFGEGGIWNF